MVLFAFFAWMLKPAKEAAKTPKRFEPYRSKRFFYEEI
jgi:hypothetical protein